MACIVITNEVREIARRFPSLTVEEVANFIGMWLESTNNGVELFPTPSELNKFIKLVRNTEPINVYFGSNENANLSNFAVRPFSTDLGTFNTVEGAFQALKIKYASDEFALFNSLIVEQLMTATGPLARALGKKIKGLDTKLWDSESYSVMESLIYQSFELNPNALKLLLDTGTRPITHTLDKSKWRTLFPDALMSVRSKFSSDNNGNIYQFDVLPISKVDLFDQVDMTFDPRSRRDRVTLLSRLFSRSLDNALREYSEDLLTQILNSDNPLTRASLQALYDSLDRMKVLEMSTPGNLFNLGVLPVFLDYLNLSMEDRIELEYLELVTYDLPQSNTELREIARQKAEYNSAEYLKIVDNFPALAEEASLLLSFSEGIRIDLSNNPITEMNVNNDDPDGYSEIDEQADDYSKEESIKDGWMSNYRNLSAHESISLNTRKIILTIPRIGADGYYEVDDLGFLRYLDADYVHATLIDKLRFITASNQMIPMLRQLSRTKPWVEELIEVLEGDEQAFSQFYQDFRKDFMPYWIQKRRTLPNGLIKSETIGINKPSGTYYLLDEWRDNYESGTVLNSNSIYDASGKLNPIGALRALNELTEITNKANNLTLEELIPLLEDNSYIDSLINVLNSVGVTVNRDILKESLMPQILDQVTIHSKLPSVLLALNVIISGVNKASILEGIDLINNYGSAYNTIAKSISDVTEDAIESSVHQNGKSYYSHVVPSYLGKLMKLLKNVAGTEEEFLNFIETEFKLYDWFYKDGRWRHEWLRLIVEDPKSREGLDHKMLLDVDRLSYVDLDNLDYTMALITEYLSEPKSDMAWFHVPIMSDAPSAEFIRFKRIKNGQIDEVTGNKLSYDDVIIRNFVDVISLEVDRIRLVTLRDELIRAGNEHVLPIKNYDIVRNKDGTIKSIGGAEFKFFPMLNSLRFDGKTFYQRINEIINDTSNTENLLEFIEGTLRDIVESEFNQTMDHWEKIGLLDKVRPVEPGENPNNVQYKNIPFQSYERAREALREYFYNSKLATMLIIELVTTDLAYYSNIEDFQKRNKQIHAPSLRLNTEATFNGVLEGKLWEKTIYLLDLELPSPSLDDIREVLNQRVSSGQLTSTDRDYILTKFKKNNVADAQAYRSLSSYRSVLIMAGQWDLALEDAYNNFRSGTWSAVDFLTLWLPRKPFVYTLVQKNSGIEGFSNMKVPMLNKNSEFLLMAALTIVASSTGKSGKLKAINDFMERNGIDVILFESAVKAGLLGAINLNDTNSYASVMSRLTTLTRLTDGHENPNVVHKISYADYGIQLAVPEHAIDATLLFGTLIRKLITADIADNAQINIGGKTLSKSDWLKLYNSTIVENLILSYENVALLFSSPLELEKVLIDEVRSNSRYGPETLKAVTLDKDGNFNLPLFDPVLSLRILSLLNSIIKSRITKLKIKGGSLVQVSDWGLTDELKIVFEGEGASKRIKHLEVYMPWYTREYLEPLIKEGSHELDISKVPDDLRRLIGYRIKL